MGLYEPEARMAAAISRDLQLDAEGLPAIHCCHLAGAWNNALHQVQFARMGTR
jgi:hypothetical protein